MSEIANFRVRYRVATPMQFANPAAAALNPPTFEDDIKKLLSSTIGKDVNQRVISIIEDETHKLCLHFSKTTSGAIGFDLLHLDGRTTIPTWKIPTEAVPVSELGGTSINPGEIGMQEPAYLLVIKNHVAVIERVGLRTSAIEHYLNQLLQKLPNIASQNVYWKLVPKIEASGFGKLKGGVEKIILKPRGALIGHGNTEVSHSAKAPKNRTRKIDDLIAFGDKIFSVMNSLGASQSDIDKIREKMSSDLVLKAKVEISIVKAERKTEAKLSADDISTALAHLSENSDVEVVDKDGKGNGKLTQLTHPVEIAQKDGIIELQNAIDALQAAMHAWSAKGVIEL